MIFRFDLKIFENKILAAIMLTTTLMYNKDMSCNFFCLIIYSLRRISKFLKYECCRKKKKKSERFVVMKYLWFLLYLEPLNSHLLRDPYPQMNFDPPPPLIIIVWMSCTKLFFRPPNLKHDFFSFSLLLDMKKKRKSDLVFWNSGYSFFLLLLLTVPPSQVVETKT